ncbi:hypothetical protein BC332_29487 [Capsicum chinense]|nr:hypothetical protein BC332_29487 [Capsicum chinense]
MANGWRCCYCCWNEERTALLQLKANIKYSTSDDDYLSSWGANETSDCCRWEGIVCSNTTRRVLELSIIAKEEQLSNGIYTGDILSNWLFNASSFVPFKNLKALLAGWVKNEGFEKLRRLRKLEVLDLSGNSFNHSIFEPISQLSSLKSLNLSRKFIGLRSDIWFTHNKTGSVSERLSGLDKLEILDFSYNYLDLENIFSTLRLCDLKYLEEPSLSRIGRLPACLGNLTFLRVVDLTNNHFTGNIASSPLSSLLSLEYLLLDTTTLKYQFHSSHLLTIQNLNFPNWLLENNSRLGEVHLDGNAFTGSLQLPPFLSSLDLSDNNLSGNIPEWLGNISSLIFLALSRNHLKGHIPPDYCRLEGLWVLDLSENNLAGMIPSCFREFNMFSNSSYLKLLDLRENNFSGSIPKWLGNNINNFENLYLDGNNFSGPIPQKLSTALFLSSLDLSENNLSGNIPAWLGNISSLRSLALSRNHLKGHIPPDYCRLEALDLCENNLVGVIPYLRENNFSGAIPKWLGSTFDITILLLKGNHLQGTIPPLLYHASNNKKGAVSLTDAYVTKVFGGDAVIGIESSIKRSLENMLVDTFAWVGAEFTTKYNTYSYEGRMVDYMCGIDLSYNQLSGEIPKELSNLTEIHALNLSHNHLTGAIPSEFSNLQNIESLDLSYNNLTGSIPTQLLKLTTLAVFTVAHNNLTGRTPQRSAQFATFSESSYEGNPFLCGLPLNISCTESKEIPIYPPAPNCCEDDVSFLDVEAFYISFLVAYANVAVAVVLVLWVNPYWRNVWFHFVESFMYSCYDYFALKCRPNLLRSL